MLLILLIIFKILKASKALKILKTIKINVLWSLIYLNWIVVQLLKYVFLL